MVSVEYLAGFIDGEGYLALGRIPRGTTYEYPVRLVVYNTNPTIIETIRGGWGGTISKSDSRKPGWKPQYALIWTNAAAAEVLAKVAPYLRIKERQVALLLEFHARVRGSRRLRDAKGRLLPLSGDEQRSRAELYERIKNLNARGPRNPSSFDEDGGPPMDLGSRNGPSVEYLAGFIDGEGSLMINRVKPKGSQQMQHRARIAIGNTHRGVLEDLQRTYGGILATDFRDIPGWKDRYQLVWTGGMVESILRAIGPYLVIKQEQAKVMMEFLDHKKRTPRVRDGARRRFFASYPVEVIAYREGLCLRMKSLNARGTNGQTHAGANLNP